MSGQPSDPPETVRRDPGEDPAERRRSPRIQMPRTGGPVSVVGAAVVNVSAGGMMIESLVPMETDVVLPLRISISGRRCDVSTRVAVCTQAPGEGRKHYRLGLEFVSLSADVRERLAEALHPHPA